MAVNFYIISRHSIEVNFDISKYNHVTLFNLNKTHEANSM